MMQENPPTEEWGETMPSYLRCRKCQAESHPAGAHAIITFQRLDGNLELRGVLVCLCDRCDGYKWPIAMREDEIVETAPTLPASESQRLSNVPLGILEDVQEAEADHFAQNYKSSVVMCRRALQLALEEGLSQRKAEFKDRLTLGPLLGITRTLKPPLLSEMFLQLAERVKDFGDEGAHKKVGHLSGSTVAVVIHDTVEVLNELYKPTASQ